MALVMSVGIGLEQRELIGIAVQRQQPVADQVDGGLVAGAEQQNDIGGQFLIGELAAVFLGLHQLRGQVVAGVLPPQLEQLLEIHLGHQRCWHWPARFRLGQRHRIEQASAVARTGVEHLAMLLGNSEHVADDRDRQPERKILDQVHMALVDNAIQRFIDDLLDARTHVLDPARGKRFHDQAAQPRVVGRILLQHPVAHAAEDRLLHDLRSIAPLWSARRNPCRSACRAERDWPPRAGSRRMRQTA